MFHFRVDLSAEENDDRRYPKPRHETDHRAQ
jgi:hypothetical protein